MGKTRNLFKKIRDTKGTFHAKMGTIKDRSGMDLVEAEETGGSKRPASRLERRAESLASPRPRVARESWGWRSSHCRA